MRINLYIYFLIISSFFGCNKIENNSLSIITSNDTIKINSFSLLENQNGALFIGLNYDDVDKNNLRQEIAKQINITLYNSTYIARPLRINFSDVRSNTDFVFPVENETRKMILDTVKNQLIFTLASIDKKTDELKSVSKMKIKKFNSNDK